MNTLARGSMLGPYRLAEPVGSGGIGQIWRALSFVDGDPVAVKIFHSILTAKEDFVGHFFDVAESVRKLSHPGIIHVQEARERDGHHYLVMDLFEGRNLEKRLDEFAARGEQMPLDEAVRVAIAVGEALEYAHSQGVVHRDVKPSNILCNEQSDVALTDFGIVRMIGLCGLDSLIVRTPQYIAPELMDGLGDERSDVYSLGIVLYEMVTGCVPYDASTAWGVMLKHIDAQLPPLREMRRDLSQRLEGIVYRAVVPDPDYRFRTMAEMVQELRLTPEAQVEPAEEAADQPSGDKGEDPVYLNRLRRLLVDRFSLEELRLLCAELGIQHDIIPGHDSMQTMPLGLVTYLKHRDRVDELVRAGKVMRPDVPWDKQD